MSYAVIYGARVFQRFISFLFNSFTSELDKRDTRMCETDVIRQKSTSSPIVFGVFLTSHDAYCD